MNNPYNINRKLTDPETTDSALVTFLSLSGIDPVKVECLRRFNGQLQVVFRYVEDDKFVKARRNFYEGRPTNLSALAILKTHKDVVMMIRKMKLEKEQSACTESRHAN